MKKKLLEYISHLHLQNNNFRYSDDAFKYGIECAIDELIELKILRVTDVIKNEEAVCCSCNMVIEKEYDKFCRICWDCK